MRGRGSVSALHTRAYIHTRTATHTHTHAHARRQTLHHRRTTAAPPLRGGDNQQHTARARLMANESEMPNGTVSSPRWGDLWGKSG